MSVPVVLLAGGLGTRLREETDVKPKPMVEVGGHPILWHIMKSYASYGFDEFVICLGYKGDTIKDFFLNYRSRQGGVSVDLATGRFDMHEPLAGETWKVHLLETGLDTMTGGRIRRAAQFLGGRRFMATYGDGVSDIDLRALLALHESSGKRATITAVRPPARFGGLKLEGDQVSSFDEKPQIGEGWINGGYMVFEPGVVDLIEGDATVLERYPLETLADQGQLAAYKHEGFWQCMDTVRDLTLLRDLWDRGAPPWKHW
jgi:glucose-1-phosphate cytidylyltransferase